MICRVARWKDLDRWDWVRVSSVAEHSDLPATSIGEFLRRRIDPVDRKTTSFADIMPISIHFDGSISKRVLSAGREYTLPMLRVRPGDVVLSKIDLKNGAVGVRPDDWPSAAVTTRFAVYEPDKRKVLPEFFRLLVQSPRFKAWLDDFIAAVFT
jgi:type I restriction enzyme S subunit